LVLNKVGGNVEGVAEVSEDKHFKCANHHGTPELRFLGNF
jgi:hypothetical protein